MAELGDAPGLGPGAFGREGSNPFSRTNIWTRRRYDVVAAHTALMVVGLSPRSVPDVACPTTAVVPVRLLEHYALGPPPELICSPKNSAMSVQRADSLTT